MHAFNKSVGSKAVIDLGRDKVELHLKPGVVLACENSYVSVTILDDIKTLEDIIISVE